jgi:hypothetical protein
MWVRMDWINTYCKPQALVTIRFYCILFIVLVSVLVIAQVPIPGEIMLCLLCLVSVAAV